MTNKEIITAFYEEFFNQHVIEAAEKYIRIDYIQHNPGVPQGRAGIMDAFREKFITDPDFHLDIEMMISEKDKIAVYLKNRDIHGATRCRVVDIYRIQDQQLAEHWDVLQPVQ